MQQPQRVDRGRSYLALRLVYVLTALLTLVAARRAEASDESEAKKIFNQRCTACHTHGKGVKVGPDLKGVTARRPRDWLVRFIRSSQSLIQARDPIAAGLFEQYQRQRMPDWTDLSDLQIGAVLDWLAGEGPDQKEPDERGAELATAAEIELARRLFRGAAAFTAGGVSCSSCHSIRDNGRNVGGSLGPNLTVAYRKYGDRGLTLFLKQPCFPREPESSSVIYLTPEERFVLKAFLRQADPASAHPVAPAPPEPSPPSSLTSTEASIPFVNSTRTRTHTRHKAKRGAR